jgi:hypothetical protein
MIQQGQCVQAEGQGSRRSAALGVPVPDRGSRLGAAAGGWVREPRRGGESTSEGARPARTGRRASDDHAGGVRGRVSGDASGGAGDDREAALAARQSDRRARGEAAGRSVAEGRVRMAHDRPRGTPLRGDAGTSASSQSCCLLGGCSTTSRPSAASPNPARRAREKRPFETWKQVEAVAAQLGPVYGPMVIFAAATGLRPSESFGLDRRDVDRRLGVVYIRRAYANVRLRHTKTRLSTRAVPLQAKALEALDRLPVSDNPILFPNTRGGRIDFRILGRKH